MLKNENLKQINNTITLLTTIKLYLLENDPTDFIDKTGIDLIDIQHNIKNLIAIHTQETIEHKRNSLQSCIYKKEHRERRNIVQNINNAKHKNDKKKLEYWAQKLKEYDGNKN